MAKRVVILGGGESGAGSAVLAKVKDFDVFLSDNNPIKDEYKELLSRYEISFEENGHSIDAILNADIVIKSPGIPDTIALIKEIKGKNIPVISEIEFAGRFTNAKTVCITGSNGKTTTTLLTYHILKSAGLNVGLAGNVGKSFALQVAEENFDIYVLELSSFQLDGMYDFKADVAILMNITPDHLDRYDYNFQNYIDSKFRIIQNQTEKDYFVYCMDDEVIMKEIKNYNIKSKMLPFTLQNTPSEGAYIENNNLIITLINKQITMTIYDLALEGKHNTYNSMAAGIAANIFNLRKDKIRDSLADFQGVEHRLEHVVRVHGIDFINDSKATNVNSTWYALETIDKPIIWIAGGVDKGNDYEILKDIAKEKVKLLICLGKDNDKLKEAFTGVVPTVLETTSIGEAVRTAYYLSKKDYKVLLSPACASFDLFENYEDRGRKFKQSVRNL